VGKDLIDGIIQVVVAILGIALIAVILGRAAQTANVIKTSGQAFSEVLGEALKPVS
jgi:hypothetical protein